MHPHLSTRSVILTDGARKDGRRATFHSRAVDSLRVRHKIDWSVIIAVVAVRMVQMSVHEVIHVVTMRDGFVATVWTMDVVWIVTTAGVRRSARLGIRIAHGNDVFFDCSSICLVMEVPIVQIVDVPVVFDGRVAATFSVLMIVILMTLWHDWLLFDSCSTETLRVKWQGKPTARRGKSVHSSLAGVGQSIGDQLRNVVIAKFVVDVLPFSRRGHDPLALQQLQSLRNRGHVVIHRSCDLGNAHSSGTDQHQDAESVEVTQRAEQVGSPLAGNRIKDGIPEPTTASVVDLTAIRRVWFNRRHVLQTQSSGYSIS